MKICPSCEEEFVDHMKMCPDCDQALLSEFDMQEAPKKEAMTSKEELLQAETFPLIEGSLTTCRELEGILSKAKIPSAVYPASLKSEDNAATLGSAAALKYLLLVGVEDVERCKQLIEGRFHDQVAREGQGKFVSEIVDLSADEISCPACQERGALINGECPSCGLFLGGPPEN